MTPRLALCVSLPLFTALALTFAPSEAQAGELGKIQLTVGAKGGASGNYLNEPDNGPEFVAGPFEEGAGGWGGGGGIFAEARFLKGHLGFETGMNFDWMRNKSTIDISVGGVNIETEWGWKQMQMRIPFLLQGGTSDQKGKPRFAVGIGPEIVVPLSSSPISDVTQGAEFVPDGFFSDDFTVIDKTYVNFLANIGVGIPVGPVRITFDLRYALGLGMPKEYDERVPEFTPSAMGYTTEVLARYNMDLRVLLGVGYDFKFGK